MPELPDITVCVEALESRVVGHRLEVFESTLAEFAERLARENHTLKRSLTDPRLFSGIGNAYTDDIPHRARLSPVKHTRRLTAGKLLADRALSRLLKQDWPRSIDDLTWS